MARSPDNRTDDHPGSHHLFGLRPDLISSVQKAMSDGDNARLRRLVLPLHYSDVADLLERLPRAQRRDLIHVLRDAIDPVMLGELKDDLQGEVLSHLEPAEIVDAVTQLDSDDAAQVVHHLPDETRNEILEQLPAKDRAVVEEALAWPEDSAGRLMQRETISVPSFWNVGETIDHMRQADDLPADFYDIFVVDPTHKPIGTLPLNQLVRTRREVPVLDIMNSDIHPIPVVLDQEDVALHFRDQDLVSAPVIDDWGRLVGMITVDDVVDVIDKEAEEDLMYLGGISRHDLFQTTGRTVRSRFSWLSINLLTAIFASVIIAFFEATLEDVVALAILMPIVASMGGNAGTQTMTVAVRALAMRELGSGNILRFVGKELLVGFINGILFSLLIGFVVALWFASIDLGVVIAIAMICNLVVAGLAGTLIPVTLQRAGADPAIASTVFLTTVTDLVGFVTFLGLGAIYLT